MTAMTTIGIDSAAKRIECPRCGYDQQGEISRWTDRCPLAGTCNECGLDLEWRDVFTFSRHPWLFEYHWRDRPVRRLLLTLCRAPMPRRFWTEVRLEDPVYVRPVGTVIAILTAIFLIGYTLMATSVVASDFGGIELLADATYREMILDEVRSYWWSELTTAVAAAALVLFVMPLTFLMLPITLCRARVRARHVARIGLYAFAAPFVVAVAWVLFQMFMHLVGQESLAAWINPWIWATHSFHHIGYLTPYTLVGIGLAALCALWMSYWWWIACRRYLRLPRAGIIVLLMTFVALLAGTTGHVYLNL